MTGTIACIGFRAACRRDRREGLSCRPPRAASPAPAPPPPRPRLRARRGRVAVGLAERISRTPAEIQFATSAWRKALSAVSHAMPCPAQATPTATGSATGPLQTVAKHASAGHGHAAPVASRKARPGRWSRGSAPSTARTRPQARRRRATPHRRRRQRRGGCARRTPHRRNRRLSRASPRASAAASRRP